jgi:hypothetical protein
LLFLPLPFLQSPRNSNRPYRDLMPCTSPRLTRVKKGITNLRAPSMPTPKEHLQRGKIPAQSCDRRRPQYNLPFFFFLFVFVSHTHIHVIANCATPQCHGPYQSQYENNSRLNRHRGRSEALRLLALATLPDLDVSGTLSRCMLRQFCMW